jgi:hypothetical protein
MRHTWFELDDVPLSETSDHQQTFESQLLHHKRFLIRTLDYGRDRLQSNESLLPFGLIVGRLGLVLQRALLHYFSLASTTFNFLLSTLGPIPFPSALASAARVFAI